MTAEQPHHDRYVAIQYFTKEMLGLKDRNWYYRHVDDPGMPQRIYVAGKPMLSLADCNAYMAQLRGPAKPVKRRPGRPRRQLTL